jgi:hypothetical protein
MNFHVLTDSAEDAVLTVIENAIVEDQVDVGGPVLLLCVGIVVELLKNCLKIHRMSDHIMVVERIVSNRVDRLEKEVHESMPHEVFGDRPSAIHWALQKFQL